MFVHSNALPRRSPAAVEPGVRAAATILKGSPLDTLLQFAHEQEADLILIGHRGGCGAKHRLACGLVRSVPSSVWMVPEYATPQIRRF